jgi:hypothetical protein
MDGASRGTRRILIITVVVAALAALLLPTVPAVAADPPFGQIVCDAAGALTIIPNPPGPSANQWYLVGRGSCLGDNQGTYFADITGVGHSDTLGLCDPQSNPFVMNFEMQVTVNLTSTSDPQFNRVYTERWAAPLTTFPIATPFLDTDGGLQNEDEYVGAGTILTHIYAQCPPGGSPSAQIAWARTV